MGSEWADIAARFAAGARERLDLAGERMLSLEADPDSADRLRRLREEVRWVALWGPSHGFLRTAEAARDLEHDAARMAILARTPDAGDLARWQAALDGLAATLAAEEPDALPREGLLVFTERPDGLALLDGSDDVAVMTDRVAEALALLAERDFAAVVVDLAGRIDDALEVIRAAGGDGALVDRPRPAVLALADPASVVRRLRAEAAGVDEVLPRNASRSPVAAAIREAREHRDVPWGTVFLLGSAGDLAARLEEDAVAGGLRFRAFRDLPAMLGEWLPGPPDLLVVAGTGDPGRALAVVRDLRYQGESLPILVAVDAAGIDARRAVEDAGAEPFLVPYLRSEFASRVARVLEVHRLLRRPARSAAAGAVGPGRPQRTRTAEFERSPGPADPVAAVPIAPRSAGA